ncbi:aldehyde ferredoxin oxidoreductase N-terminal domain-containing protein, partial [Desulfomarina sp.]
MMREEFRILFVDGSRGKGKIILLDGRNEVAGGSGLAAMLYEKYGYPELDWDDPAQPLIFAIGPLTGCFPLMSKTVFAFKSAYHGEYTESHAGGRLALALRFSDLDALVIVGKADRLSCLSIGASHLELTDVEFMAGMDSESSGRLIRRMYKKGSGHRSILRIGPSGEAGLAMACVNVDTFRHFGRMGGGAALGAKNIKAVIIHGDSDFATPSDKAYLRLYKDVYGRVTATDMMRKYHNLGTPANLEKLNDISSLPWRNLQKTCDPAISAITGKVFADKTLLRNGACSGCPVGCIHIGFIREKMVRDNRYHFHQVAYDYEPIFALGTMLGVVKPFDILRILDEMEKSCLDAMSGGVALAWAAEATERGLLSRKETLVDLCFGDGEGFRKAARYLGRGANEFYQQLGQGTLKAATVYGGGEFACVLGQEMAGYATGELFFAAQTLGFRHSHLDTGAYGYDQKVSGKDVEKGVDFLIGDEPARVFLTSMVACLFARSVYREELLAECLESVGFSTLAGKIGETAEYIRGLRWRVRAATGFNPENFSIPKRFYSVSTWKGKVDTDYLNQLK